MLIAGDTIIDWIIKDGKVDVAVGGVGNLVRGLKKKGHDPKLLTLYNPMLYPLSYVMPLHENSLTDFNHRNVFVRDYDRGVYQRFRENLRKNVFDVSGAFAVVCHEDSVIRKFDSFYADVRDTSVSGKCAVLRMSSSDDYEAIMEKVSHLVAIVTFKDKVKIMSKLDYETTRGGAWHTVEFQAVDAVDDIGAGDTFNVGFLDYIDRHGYKLRYELVNAIKAGIDLAQEKVQKIGVFM